MARVKVYSTGVCPICQKAKRCCCASGTSPYDEVRIDLDRPALREFSQATNGAHTVPQILIDGRCVGGFMELTELHMEGGLDGLMQIAQLLITQAFTATREIAVSTPCPSVNPPVYRSFTTAAGGTRFRLVTG